MEQSEELSLWLAKAWLETSGEDVQALIVADLEEQAEHGTPLEIGMAALKRPERQAGDFGMAIAGTLLAPILVELLKEFWSGYLKELEKEAEGALAKKSIDAAKKWFLASFGKRRGGPVDQLEQEIKNLAVKKKLTREEEDRLLRALHDARLPAQLGGQV